MNKLERLIYNLVKANPRLKVRIRDSYQRLFDLAPIGRMATAYGIEARNGFFFGFHDKCPWSADEERLLAHRITAPVDTPRPEDELEVGFFSGEGFQHFTRVGTTRAWNWHMGAMLQWVGESDRILFNGFDGRKLVALLMEPDGRKAGVLPAPVAALAPNGGKAVSLNFPRLQRTPHKYGYAHGDDPDADRLVPSTHGLSVIDVSSGSVHLLMSVADICAIRPEPSMEGAFHYVSHCQFSPTGERFIFYHRWTPGKDKVLTRMISTDLQGSHVHVFPTLGMVSHYSWQDGGHVLAYARASPWGDGYYLFEDQSENYRPVGRGSLVSDGHPSFASDARWFATDTYPDRSRMRRLILYDLARSRRYDLARLHSPAAYRDHLRCDLHPRWSRSATMVCFDSAHNGERSLCTIDLGDVVAEGGEPRSL